VKKADASALVPKIAAVRLSRTNPSTRETIVKDATKLMFFRFFDTRAVLGALFFLSKKPFQPLLIVLVLLLLLVL
jgi:hypothetical protein